MPLTHSITFLLVFLVGSTTAALQVETTAEAGDSICEQVLSAGPEFFKYGGREGQGRWLQALVAGAEEAAALGVARKERRAAPRAALLTGIAVELLERGHKDQALGVSLEALQAAGSIAESDRRALALARAAAPAHRSGGGERARAATDQVLDILEQGTRIWKRDEVTALLLEAGRTKALVSLIKRGLLGIGNSIVLVEVFRQLLDDGLDKEVSALLEARGPDRWSRMGTLVALGRARLAHGDEPGARRELAAAEDLLGEFALQTPLSLIDLLLELDELDSAKQYARAFFETAAREPTGHVGYGDHVREIAPELLARVNDISQLRKAAALIHREDAQKSAISLIAVALAREGNFEEALQTATSLYSVRYSCQAVADIGAEAASRSNIQEREKVLGLLANIEAPIRRDCCLEVGQAEARLGGSVEALATARRCNSRGDQFEIYAAIFRENCSVEPRLGDV